MLFRVVLAFAFFIFSLRAAEEGMKNFIELSEKCERENGLTNGEIQRINETKPIETDDIKVKCYFRCLLLELNLMDSNGNLILEGMPNVKPEYWKYIVDCSNTTGVESCDKALNFENCVWTKKIADQKSN